MTDQTAFGAVSEDELKSYMEQQITTGEEGAKGAKPKKANKKAAAEGTPVEKPPKAEKAKIEPHACKCGCGKTITTSANFVPGHDAKAKSMLAKANAGKLPEGETVPEILLEYAKGNDKWRAWYPELFATV